MALRALEWPAASPRLPTPRTDFEPAGLSRPDRAATAGLPVVYLVRIEDLPLVGADRRAVVDCGTRRPNRALSGLLLGRSRVPVVAGHFKVAGQAERSVRTLLDNAVRAGDRNAYVIGVPEELLSELWARARDRRSDRAASGDAARPLDLLPPRAVPRSLAERYVGSSTGAELVRQLILRAADRDDPVLVSGEAGSGRQLVARAIHEHSRRRTGPFVAVDCGAIPRDLIESELFGHERGAFAGARRKKVGLWQVASRGTLFLQDVGRLSPRLQARVLAALRDGVIHPTGADDEVRVAARVIAAAHGDLYAMVEARGFRDDLYFRLRTIHIRTPTLREHREDVEALAGHFWRALSGDAEARLPGSVIQELMAYRWPGNARELRAALASLMALFGSKAIRPDHVRAAFEIDGRGTRAPADRRTVQEAQRLERIRHLRDAAEAIQAAGITLRPLAGSGRLDPSAARALHAAVGPRLQELDALVRRSSLFGDEVTLDLVVRLVDRLVEVRRGLVKDAAEARDRWRREVGPDLRLATRAVLAELRRQEDS